MLARDLRQKIKLLLTDAEGVCIIARLMRLPEDVRAFFRRQGSIGGKKRNAQLSPEQRSAIGRKAAQARWAKVRENRPDGKQGEKKSKRGAV